MVAATHNGYDPAKVGKFVGDIEKIMAQMESEKGSYMARMKGFREDISAIYDEAKDAGLPKKEMKAVVKARELERKVEKLRDGLTDDQQDAFDLLRHALGDLADTPLGRAALGEGAGDEEEVPAMRDGPSDDELIAEFDAERRDNGSVIQFGNRSETQ